jgi:nucleoside-diphosphate-sugar epimerase
VYISDIDKVSRSLGWKPKIGPVEGVKLLTEWVKENKELFK